MSFKSLGLRSELINAVTDKGYTIPTPIQREVIPPILSGQDIIGSAQTGTGKTAGFILPILHKLSLNNEFGNKQRVIRALILTPTRELAAQVADNSQHYGKYLSLRSTVIFGGVNIKTQIKKLRSGTDMLVATPGRLLDHISQNTINLDNVEVLVLDEADRMLDMGFIHDVKKILKLIPKKKQCLLFSATFSNAIKNLSNSFLKSPIKIEVVKCNTISERVKQTVHPVDKHRKRELLSYLIGFNNWQRVLVFCRTKFGANRLSEKLIKDGITAAAIHGNKSQGARTRALADFKSGKIKVLVATDIAARGLDINQLPHVINYELPQAAEDYVHRIGRTGRAGHEGHALSLVCADEMKNLRAIELKINFSIPKIIIEDFEPKTEKNSKPSKKKYNKKISSKKSKSISKSKQFNSIWGNRHRDKKHQTKGKHNYYQRAL